MNMLRVSRSALGAFVALVASVSVFTAQATTLVYEGFASSDYEAGKSINGKKTASASIGLDTANGWNTGTGVFTAQSNGLSLPDIWMDGKVHGTQNLRAVLYNGTATSTTRDNRAQQRGLTCTWPTSGSVYFRFLMQVPKDALNTSYLGAGNYWLTGLGTEAIAKPTDAGCIIAPGIYMGARNRNGTLEVAAYVKNPAGGSTFSMPLFAIDTSKTLCCACIAKIDIGENGNDTLSFYAAPTNSLTTNFEWTFTTNGISLVSGSAKPSYLQMIGQYKVNSQFITFDEFIVTTDEYEAYTHAAPTTPVLGDITLARTSASAYSLTAVEAVNAADLSWIANAGTSVSTNGTTSVSEGATNVWAVSGLTADKTWQISVLAENANGSAEKVAGTLYTGALTLGETTNAQEYGLVPGGVVVSRAEADPFPLTVNYTIIGSAGTEGTTWAAPVPVTIPANAASATLPVVPLMDSSITADVTITVSLAQGNYELPSSNSVTLALVNLAAPPGKKTWVATANGNASDGANWSPSGAPTATDEILFDGNFSNARCIWDAAATHTVAAWEQASTFTGTIELQTTYESGAFAALAITDDCTINGGTMTQTANSNAQTYRLSLTVGGDLSVASGAQITATGKGYASGYPNGVTAGTHGGSVTAWSQVYGDFRNPTDIGAGGGSSGLTGGGAIRIIVTGTATVDGQLLARPSASDKENHIFGAGGSICVSASSISGSGSINASGYGSQTGGRSGGGGGRVALYVTGEDSMSFPLANVTATGTVGAWNKSGGAGTVFVKTRNQTNGTLVVDDVTVTSTEFRQYLHTRHAATPIPTGETWTLDELRFRNSGILVVPEGTTLNIPLAAISSTSDRTAGILYEGGTINFTDVQPGGPYALTGKWVFQASSPYTFDGNVTISGGAAIGGLRMSGTFDDFATCDVTVNGDLSVAADGWLYADSAGLAGGASGFTTGPARHGGQMAGSSGNICYDSVFAPCLPAVNSVLSHEKESPGGGVIKLMVNGALTLDGKATAEGPVRYKGAGSGGTINITAQTLSGSGSISASGTAGAIAWDEAYNGAGGRIAVRVTGENVGTNGVWTKIYARGVATNQVNTANVRNQNCSAGTIYLQGKSDGEKGGTIYVKNQKSYDTSNVATWIPAASRGDAAEDFKKAKLVIADRGVVAVGTNKLAFATISIAANSVIDLKGATVKVGKAYLGEVKLPSGEYTAESEAVVGYVVDSVGGGKLKVGDAGFAVRIR